MRADRGGGASRAASLTMLAGLPRAAWIALCVMFAAAWFATLDLRKLQHPDEGRYAEIAREMVATGDWLTTRSAAYP